MIDPDDLTPYQKFRIKEKYGLDVEQNPLRGSEARWRRILSLSLLVVLAGLVLRKTPVSWFVIDIVFEALAWLFYGVLFIGTIIHFLYYAYAIRHDSTGYWRSILKNAIDREKDTKSKPNLAAITMLTVLACLWIDRLLLGGTVLCGFSGLRLLSEFQVRQARKALARMDEEDFLIV